MTEYDSLKTILVDFFRNYKAYELKTICEKYCIQCNNEMNPMHSKRLYVESGLSKKSFSELQEIAKEIIANECDNIFVKKVEPYLDDDFFEIPMTTRRMILNWLCSQNNLEGKVDICHLISCAWNIDEMQVTVVQWNEQFPLKEYVIQHMIRNDDITYRELFEDLLDFMYISNKQLIVFLESLVNPSIREPDEQEYYVSELNHIICSEGFQLVQRKSIAGQPIYELEKASLGISGKIQNIIFGAYDVKPDIVIDDSLLNTLKIVGDEEKCLFYNLPISINGLSWHDLVTWWNKGNTDYDIEIEKTLVNRLKKSLDSEPEVTFIRTYYNLIHKLGNNELPALIPQVYCHYDPKSAKMRKGQVYVLQRMDFLLLLPYGHRVVIEIDGKHHYANDNIASPSKYASMVRDDRNLKLYGYDVYRFGGHEFTSQNIVAIIEEFIINLFKKYGVI